MTADEAAALIAGARPAGTSPETWADLGCGDGTFTIALATLLPDGSVIHAMDRDAASLREIPGQHGGVALVTHAGDFTRFPWPFDPPNGVMLANSLHYVSDQPAFIRRATEAMPRARFIIVEYDTDDGNPWVPYPLSRQSLARVCEKAGLASMSVVGTRRSLIRRAPLYAASIG